MQPGLFNLNEDDIKATMTPLNDTNIELNKDYIKIAENRINGI